MCLFGAGRCYNVWPNGIPILTLECSGATLYLVHAPPVGSEEGRSPTELGSARSCWPHRAQHCNEITLLSMSQKLP
eukprot:5662462-Amphidinium_carterae.1